MHSSRRNNLQLLTRKTASFCGESACKTAVSTAAQQVSWLDNSEALFRPAQGVLCSLGGAFFVFAKILFPSGKLFNWMLTISDSVQLPNNINFSFAYLLEVLFKELSVICGNLCFPMIEENRKIFVDQVYNSHFLMD